MEKFLIELLRAVFFLDTKLRYGYHVRITEKNPYISVVFPCQESSLIITWRRYSLLATKLRSRLIIKLSPSKLIATPRSVGYLEGHGAMPFSFGVCLIVKKRTNITK